MDIVALLEVLVKEIIAALSSCVLLPDVLY